MRARSRRAKARGAIDWPLSAADELTRGVDLDAFTSRLARLQARRAQVLEPERAVAALEQARRSEAEYRARHPEEVAPPSLQFPSRAESPFSAPRGPGP